MEARRTNPTVVVFGNIAFGQYIWTARFREFCPATLAVVMVPALSVKRVLLELQDSPTRPFRTLDPPIAQSTNLRSLNLWLLDAIKKKLHRVNAW